MIFAMIACVVFEVSFERISYEINDSSVVINKSGSSEGLPYNVIKDAALKPSRIFKNRGTVKIKTDGKNYYFRFVTGADKAYELILEKIRNNQE